MATIGHTLIGLSLSESCSEKARAGKMTFIWAGVVVLSAHVVDLVEWLALLVAPAHWDKHFLTHSPWIALGVAAVICIAVAITTHCRKPWPYLILVAAVLSHLLLDHASIRSLIADAYGFSVETRMPTYPGAIVAELWSYGLVFVVTTLLVTRHQRRFSRKSRHAALGLAVVCCIAAASRSPWIWGPAYAVATLHCGLLWRDRLNANYLWSLVPLIPLAILPAADIYAKMLTDKAITLRENGNYASAIELNQSILKIPTRKSYVTNYLELARSYQATGDFDRAEKAYLSARVESQNHGIYVANYFLAKFYTDKKVEGTPFFQPEKAEKLLDNIIRQSPVSDHQRWAGELRSQLRRKGILR